MRTLIVCHAACVLSSSLTGKHLAGAVKTIPFALKTPELHRAFVAMVEKSTKLTQATSIRLLWDDTMSAEFAESIRTVASTLKIPFDKVDVPHMPAHAMAGAISCIETKMVKLVHKHHPDEGLWHVTCPASGALMLEPGSSPYLRAMVAEMRQVGAQSVLSVYNQHPIVNLNPDGGEMNESTALQRRLNTAIKSFRLLKPNLDGAKPLFGFVSSERKKIVFHELKAVTA